MALRNYLTGSHMSTAPIHLDRLVQLTGQHRTSLAHAMPQLHQHNQFRQFHLHHRRTRPACTRCTAAKGISVQVSCQLRDEDVLCHRHLRWLGSYHHNNTQPRLDNHPQILRANRRHRQLISRYGSDLIDQAHREATYICQHWYRHHDHTDSFLANLNTFHSTPPTTLLQLNPIFEAAPILEAAAYPQIVALTRLLASPYWKHLPLGNETQIQTFTDELHRTVSPNFDWIARILRGQPDPLAAMFCAQALAVAQDQRQAPYLAAVVAHARQQLVTAITARATTP